MKKVFLLALLVVITTRPGIEEDFKDLVSSAKKTLLILTDGFKPCIGDYARDNKYEDLEIGLDSDEEKSPRRPDIWDRLTKAIEPPEMIDAETSYSTKDFECAQQQSDEFELIDDGSDDDTDTKNEIAPAKKGWW